MASPKEAISAAQTIAEFCKDQRMNCCDCPFGSDCLFKVCPSSWKLTNIKRIGVKKNL